MSLKSDAIFDKIVKRVAKISGEERKIEHVYRFNITVNGSVVKTWIVDLKNLKVYAGDDSSAECTLTVSDDDFVLLGTGKLIPKDALAADKLDVDGDLKLALKLEPFIASL